MKNNKGFTLIQLIISLIIMGLIVVFAVPKVNEYVLNKKKDKMIEDAKLFVEKTKKYIEMNDNAIKTFSGIFELQTVDAKKEIIKSPFGENYGRKYQTIHPYVSMVFVTIDYKDSYSYGVCLTDGKYTLDVKNIFELDSNKRYEKIRKYSFGDCDSV